MGTWRCLDKLPSEKQLDRDVIATEKATYGMEKRRAVVSSHSSILYLQTLIVQKFESHSTDFL